MEEATGAGTLTILVDHNIEGQAALLWEALSRNGWLDLFALRMVTFGQVGLAIDSDDRTVWRFAQANRMILLTDNRHREDEDALEQVIRDENTPASLPVLTIGSARRIVERDYRDRCASRLMEIVLYLENYLGTSRLFIP